MGGGGLKLFYWPIYSHYLNRAKAKHIQGRKSRVFCFDTMKYIIMKEYFFYGKRPFLFL